MFWARCNFATNRNVTFYFWYQEFFISWYRDIFSAKWQRWKTCLFIFISTFNIKEGGARLSDKAGGAELNTSRVARGIRAFFQAKVWSLVRGPWWMSSYTKAIWMTACNQSEPLNLLYYTRWMVTSLKSLFMKPVFFHISTPAFVNKAYDILLVVILSLAEAPK